MDLARLDHVAAHDNAIVRFRVGSVIGYQLHAGAADVHQLFGFRMQRADWQEAVLGELVAGVEVFAVSFPGLTHR
ncbi:hypothetical protein D3C72_2471430 [compost metagenome]